MTKKYPVPGDGGFDYVTFDDSSNRLYVSHGTKVDVLDAGDHEFLSMVDAHLLPSAGAQVWLIAAQWHSNGVERTLAAGTVIRKINPERIYIYGD